jgi:hypothetical protein
VSVARLWRASRPGQLQLALPSTVRAEVSPLQRSEQREPEPQLREHAPVHWI